MAHGAVLSSDLGHVRVAGALGGRRRRRLLARLAVVLAAPTTIDAAHTDLALTDDEMTAESAGWW